MAVPYITYRGMLAIEEETIAIKLLYFRLTLQAPPKHCDRRYLAFKNYIRVGSDLLLGVSLAGGQSLEIINHEQEARVLCLLTNDQHLCVFNSSRM